LSASLYRCSICPCARSNGLGLGSGTLRLYWTGDPPTADQEAEMQLLGQRDAEAVGGLLHQRGRHAAARINARAQQVANHVKVGAVAIDKQLAHIAALQRDLEKKNGIWRSARLAT